MLPIFYEFLNQISRGPAVDALNEGTRVKRGEKDTEEFLYMQVKIIFFFKL